MIKLLTYLRRKWNRECVDCGSPLVSEISVEHYRFRIISASDRIKFTWCERCEPDKHGICESYIFNEVPLLNKTLWDKYQSILSREPNLEERLSKRGFQMIKLLIRLKRHLQKRCLDCGGHLEREFCLTRTGYKRSGRFFRWCEICEPDKHGVVKYHICYLSEGKILSNQSLRYRYLETLQKDPLEERLSKRGF